MDSLVLALDIGTSSVRALAFDARGRKVGREAQIPYSQTTLPDGGVEIGADFLLDLLARCLDQLLPDLKQPIGAVATSVLLALANGRWCRRPTAHGGDFVGR